MNIIKDKDLIFDTDQYDVILVGTSIYCMLTNGFQSKMALKYPFIEKRNNELPYGDYKKLGTRLTCQEGNSPIISLMFICNYPNKKRVFIDYDALTNCLSTALNEFKGKSIATTVLGSSEFDGNGEKDKIIDIIKNCDYTDNLTLYDYVQIDKNKEISIEKKKLNDYKLTDYEKYQELWNNRDNILRKLYLLK